MALAPAQNAWTTALCDCTAEPSGCGFCLYAWCCGPCAYGSNVEMMEPVVCCGGDCCGACLGYYAMAVFTGCPCILHLMARGYLRNKYNIPGSGCNDFMITWCCGPCALCQERRELLIRGHAKGGVVQQSSVQAPQQQRMAPPEQKRQHKEPPKEKKAKGAQPGEPKAQQEDYEPQSGGYYPEVPERAAEN